MLKNHFFFGETHKDYEIRVFNEREARAAAGILLIFATIAFFNAFLVGNFYILKAFIIALLFIVFVVSIFAFELIPVNGYFGPEKLNEGCDIPTWAIEIGHEEEYKLHYGC